ncbi:hypothetical protein AB1Y20_013450 [Prymnesium parvum]|uniref:NYN domain-containing protein n=1 Tax=Prymnesium parvum TaxID=97485 RepID=A0AB34IHS0_PRYPA
MALSLLSSLLAFSVGFLHSPMPAAPVASACIPPTSTRAVLSMGRKKPQSRVIYIDGNNLMMQRKVSKGREVLAEKLSGVKASEVVLVFDGKRGEPDSTTGSNPQVVITSGGDEHGEHRVSADEWIIARLNDVAEDCDVQVVTADRELRRACQQASATTINPVKFWRRYLPRLKGLKNDYANRPKADDYV